MSVGPATWQGRRLAAWPEGGEQHAVVRSRGRGGGWRCARRVIGHLLAREPTDEFRGVHDAHVSSLQLRQVRIARHQQVSLRASMHLPRLCFAVDQLDAGCDLLGGDPTAKLRRPSTPRSSPISNGHATSSNGRSVSHRSSNPADTPRSPPPPTRAFGSQTILTGRGGRRAHRQPAAGPAHRSTRCAGGPRQASHARHGCTAPTQPACSPPAPDRSRPTTRPARVHW
jgi:hypothetical protein